ncbi:MAG: hypothetical protein GY940_39850 [bacterium]|nr:hypothetical protein [bacterium]
MTEHEQADNIDDMVLVQVLKIAWKRKTFILVGALLVTVAVVVYAWVQPRIYKSSGNLKAYVSDKLLRMLKDPVQDVKKTRLEFVIYKMRSPEILGRLNNRGMFLRFLEANKDTFGLDEPALEDLSQKMSINVTPSYAMRTLPNRPDLRDNFILGFQISAKSGNREQAQRLVRLLREFISTTVINDRIENYILIETGKITVSINSRQILLNNHNDSIETLLKKKKLLEKLAKDFPVLNDPRNIAAYGDEKTRFLPPLVQLMGLEISLENQRSQIERENIHLEALNLKKELFSQLDALVKKNSMMLRTGLMDRVTKILSDFEGHWKPGNGSTDNKRIQNRFLEVDRNFQLLKLIKANTFKFNVEPTPGKRTGLPGIKVIAFLGFIFGLTLFSAVAFVMESWKKTQRG